MRNNNTIIAQLRRECGFTQKTLAEALHVTDKAVSKWERGINMPDVAVLPRLSQLLGADIELLLSKEKGSWQGLLDLRNHEIDLSTRLPGKPVVYFLLSHFLLLDIKTIHVLTSTYNQEFLSSSLLTNYGFSIRFDEEITSNLMILNTPTFLFGADLTRHFQSAMVLGEPVLLETGKKDPTFFFCPQELASDYYQNPERMLEKAKRRTLGRGMIRIDMSSQDGMLDVSWFVRMYERNSGFQIADLEEISRRKGCFSEII